MSTLSKLYKKHSVILKQVRESFADENLNGPLLLAPSGYYDQAVKLLIVGQETYGWCCEYDNFDKLFQTYREFNVGENYRSSPFWNVTRKVEDLLGIQKHTCAWSNINRYDQNGQSPKGEVLEEIIKLDFIIKEEIDLLQPDICLFYTNRKYDHRLQLVFPELKISPVDGLPFNHFCRLEHPDLPPFAYRTPHPKTIRLQRWEDDFLSVMNDMLPKAI